MIMTRIDTQKHIAKIWFSNGLLGMLSTPVFSTAGLHINPIPKQPNAAGVRMVAVAPDGICNSADSHKPKERQYNKSPSQFTYDTVAN